MSALRFTAVPAVLLFCLTALAGDIPFQVDTPTGYPAPVAFSVPFAAGTVRSPDQVTLHAGTAVPPQQWRELSRWPDGSLQWAQVVTPPADRFSLALAPAARPSVPQALEFRQTAAAIELRSGDTRLHLDRATATATFTSRGRVLSFLLSQLTTVEGEVLAAQIDTLDALETGPLRAVIRARGFHRSSTRPQGFARFDVFLTLHAGSTVLEIDHALGVLSGSPEENRAREMQSFRSACIPVTLPHAPAAWTADTSDPAVPGPALAPGQRLFQAEDFAWELQSAGQVAARGDRASGLLLADTGQGACYAAVRDFWQQYPKAFTARADGFDLDLFPPLTFAGRNPYARRENEQIWYFYLRTGAYELRQGVEKSHRVFLGWDDSVAAARQSATALLTLPVVLPPLDYLNLTQVEGEFLPPLSGGLFDTWDRAFLDGSRSYFAQQVENRWYGLLNWGDWYGERRYNWCNHEYDLPANFFRQALRFGRPDFFREAVREATHRRDVDVVHAHVDPEKAGLNWKHSVGHTGGYYQPGQNQGMHLTNYGDDDRIFLEGSGTPGHTRVAGFFLQYLLTGDRRALETGRLVTDRLLNSPLVTKKNYSYITAREPGWTLVNLAAAYRATAEPRYLAAANRLADNVLFKADGHGVWLRPFKAHQTGGDVESGELSFTTAFQATGMIELYKITGRADLRQNLVETARYIVQNLYRPEYRAFVHSPSLTRRQTPRAGGLAGTNLRYVLACVYDLTHDAALLDPILDSFASTAANNQWFGTKQDPARPYPHDITSSFYWFVNDAAVMNRIAGDRLRHHADELLQRAAPASIFPPNTGRWETERIGE